MPKISIAIPQEIISIDRKLYRNIVRTVLNGENRPDADISLAFVDNPTIHRLNKQFLEHDEPTDVLSFPLSEPNAKKLAGELVIGVEVAKKQADERNHSVEAELALYLIHGLLHLCGYDDRALEDGQQMRIKEKEYLLRLGYGDITA